MSSALPPNELRAKIASPGGWGTYGSVTEHARYTKPITTPGGRAKCYCGCGSRVTHVGMTNGLGMTSGCEWSMRQWVRDPHAQARQEWERRDAAELAKPNGAVRCAGEGCSELVRRPAGMTLASVRKELRAVGWTRTEHGDRCPACTAQQVKA